MSNDHRPTTDSFLLAGYEFAVDREATAVEFDGTRVRSLKIRGDAETYRQLADDSAFPFDYAGEAPTLYAAGVRDSEGGQAERVTTDEGLAGGQDAAPHGAYLEFGGAHDVDLVVLAREGWVFVEGTATLGGNEYAVDVRVGIE